MNDKRKDEDRGRPPTAEPLDGGGTGNPPAPPPPPPPPTPRDPDE